MYSDNKSLNDSHMAGACTVYASAIFRQPLLRVAVQCSSLHCRVAFPKEEIRTAALIGVAGEAREGPVFSAY